MASDPIHLAQRSPEARVILGRIRGWGLLWGMPLGLLLFGGLLAAGFFIHRMEYAPVTTGTFTAANQLEVPWTANRLVSPQEEVALVTDSDTLTGTVLKVAPAALTLRVEGGQLPQQEPVAVRVGRRRNLHQILFGTIFSP